MTPTLFSSLTPVGGNQTPLPPAPLRFAGGTFPRSFVAGD